MKNTLNLLSDEPERGRGAAEGIAAPVKFSRARFASNTGLRPALLGGAAALLVLAAVALWYWWPRRQDAAAAAASSSAAAVAEYPPEGMVYVPGGVFVMGRDDGDRYEAPAREQTVLPFYLDKFEVTCEQYQKFVEAKRVPAPPGWQNGMYPPGSALLPVMGVNWDDASAYAEWAGKRLPTEKEWEFAARGPDGRLYPWGREWRAQAVNAKGSGPGRPTEVGLRLEGASPFGAHDMAGNVWEWTADTIRAYEGGRIEEDKLPAAEREGRKVMRGGNYESNSNQVTATYRGVWAARGGDYEGVGFRCAMDAGPRAGGK